MRALYVFVFVTIVSFCSSAQTAERVRWYTFEEALRLTAESPRNILIDVYTDWCGFCRQMEAQTFNNPVIARFINQHFYPVKFNAESTEPIHFGGHTFVNPGNPGSSRRSTHQFVAVLGATQGYPTVVYLTGDLRMIGAVPGFMRPEQIEPILHWIVEEKYLTISLEEYQKTFVSQLNR